MVDFDRISSCGLSHSHRGVCVHKFLFLHAGCGAAGDEFHRWGTICQLHSVCVWFPNAYHRYSQGQLFCERNPTRTGGPFESLGSATTSFGTHYPLLQHLTHVFIRLVPNLSQFFMQGWQQAWNQTRKPERACQNYFMCLQVTSAEICNADRTLCNSIAALNYPATAVVNVTNVGTVASSYTVSLQNCTSPIPDMDGQEITLEARMSTDVEFVVPCSSFQCLV